MKGKSALGPLRFPKIKLGQLVRFEGDRRVYLVNTVDESGDFFAQLILKNGTLSKERKKVKITSKFKTIDG